MALGQRFTWLGVSLITLLITLTGSAHAQEPVVYGVFFYSPSCGHCHEVIDNHWGGIQAQFGEQLKVLFINVQQSEGSRLMTQAVQDMGIGSNGVPMLIIGERVLIGSYQIPAETAQVVREGLAQGGIGLPPINGIGAIFSEVLVDASLTGFNTQTIDTDIGQNLLADPANLLAMVVLVALVASLLSIGIALIRPQVVRMSPRLPNMMVVSGGVLALSFSASLGLGSTEWHVTLLALAVMFLLGGVVWLSLQGNKLSHWRVPLVLLAGLLVAGYMSYVEVTNTEAICGALGQCNEVQSSEYASLIGVPIGVIGVVGYVALLIVWTLRSWDIRAEKLFLLMVMGGALFSSYLTYLEPFVIGATCLWCLTSAMTMILLLWLTLGKSELALKSTLILP